MRNFLQFIWNNQFTFLFILLEFIGFALLTTQNPFHESRVDSFTVAMSGQLGEINHAYEQYLGLKEINEALLKENARLMEQQMTDEHASRANPAIDYEVQTAHVINSTYHLGNNYLLIDKGRADGVYPQLGVMSPKGITGIVYKVSDHYSAVMPLIHSQSMISCKLEKTGYFGILKWNGKDPAFAELEDIPNHVRIPEEAKILTRGANGAFPPNQLVGFAVGSERNESSGFQTVKVKLATDFQRISNVYVIQNETKPEIDSLTNVIENE